MDRVPHYLRIIRDYDYDTYLHCNRVALFAYQIGMKIALSSEELDQLVKSALLHDLGKIKIDKSILHKPGKLNTEEWNEIRNHSRYGIELLSHEQQFVSQKIIESIYSHHEHYNGQGYPRSISGESINFNARIISIADAFDAMTTKRSYRIGCLTPMEAVQEILKCSGSQFDPAICKKLTSIDNWGLLYQNGY